MTQQPYCGIRLAALAFCLSVPCSCESGEHARVLHRGESPAAAPFSAGSPMPSPIVRRAPGSRIWKDETLMRQAGARRVRIRLRSQRGELLVDGRVAMDFPVCTGRNDSTPEGSFRILEKDRRHRSNLYHVSMPYFMRLTYDGIGLHVGDLYGAPVSHGCIRLPREACEALYNLLSVGCPVDITRS